MSRHVRLTPGAVVAQGDHSTIDARLYVNNTVSVTVEERAAILAEVGAALRPVLAQLVARVEQLEDDNRALTDTLASIAALVPARKHPLDAIGPGASCDVGSTPEHVANLSSCPAETPPTAPSWGQSSLLEELRGRA